MSPAVKLSMVVGLIEMLAAETIGFVAAGLPGLIVGFCIGLVACIWTGVYFGRQSA